jgi:hypothetical protein
MRGKQNLVPGNLEFLIGDLPRTMQLLEIAQSETRGRHIEIVRTPEALTQPHHRISGGQHDNQQKDTDENHAARAGIVISQIGERAKIRHSSDFMKQAQRGQIAGIAQRPLAAAAQPRSDMA